jgi:hypothetical protein
MCTFCKDVPESDSADAVEEDDKMVLECLEHVSCCGGFDLNCCDYCLNFLCLVLCTGPCPGGARWRKRQWRLCIGTVWRS